MGMLHWLWKSEDPAPPRPPVRQKWVPVINRGYCNGCDACVRICPSACLELVWDFATLQRPEDCGSSGMCTDACPEGLIRMDWVPVSGNREIGRWKPAADDET